MSKTILITGTSSGFGKLMTEIFLKDGQKVIATMRDKDGRNKDAAVELKAYQNAESHLSIYELDVTQNESISTAIEEIKKDNATIDVLINNAGYGAAGMTEGFTDIQFQNLFEVNVFGVHRMTRAILPMMRNSGSGLIINISSLMGRIVIPFSSLYTSSKFALEGYTESLRYELKPLGIDVAIIEPGGFGTSFMENMSAPKDEETLKQYGDYANMPNEMWSGVAENMSGADAPNPQEVADAALKLFNQAAGGRDMRIVVDPMIGGAGAPEINNLTMDKQKQLLQNFGMEAMI